MLGDYSLFCSTTAALWTRTNSSFSRSKYQYLRKTLFLPILHPSVPTRSTIRWQLLTGREKKESDYLMVITPVYYLSTKDFDSLRSATIPYLVGKKKLSRRNERCMVLDLPFNELLEWWAIWVAFPPHPHRLQHTSVAQLQVSEKPILHVVCMSLHVST